MWGVGVGTGVYNLCGGWGVGMGYITYMGGGGGDRGI